MKPLNENPIHNSYRESLSSTPLHSTTLIMKFGGASLATPEQFDQIADIIISRSRIHQRIVIVVSAMGKTTDQLIALAHSVNTSPPQREYDMLLSVGERISMSLLAMALSKRQIRAISLTGSQSGIITCSTHQEAKIVDIRPKRLISTLEKGNIVIVAGFQGVSQEGEITTLGRGGSDTSAVALGIALDACCIEFYKDVPGLFSKDPKIDSDAQFLENATYDQALHILSQGGRILHSRAVIMAKKHGIPLRILPFNIEQYNSTPKLCNGTTIEDEAHPRTIDKWYERSVQTNQIQRTISMNTKRELPAINK